MWPGNQFQALSNFQKSSEKSPLKIGINRGVHAGFDKF